jgi:hypothetical protein
MTKVISFLQTYIEHAQLTHLFTQNPDVESVVVFKDLVYGKSMIQTRIENNTTITIIDLHYCPYNYMATYDDSLIIDLEKYKTTFFLVYDRFAVKKINIKNEYNRSTLYRKYISFGLEIIKHSSDCKVLFNDIPHSPLEYIIYVLSKEKKLDLIYLQSLPKLKSHMKYKFIQTNGFEEESSKFIINYKKNLLIDDNILQSSLEQDFLSFFFISSSNGNKSVLNKVIETAIPNRLGNSINLLRRLTLLILSMKFERVARTTFKFLFYIPLEREILKQSIKKYTTKDIDSVEKKIIYFPLHTQPESTVIPATPIYYDQLIIIKKIAENLPEGFVLVVKEHPAIFTTSSLDIPEIRKPFRTALFYKEIKETKGVIIADYSLNSLDLIKKSDLIISIRGSVVIEALSFKKSVLLFGDSFYNSFPNTFRYDHNFSLKEQIFRGINHKITSRELLATLKTLQVLSFEYSDDEPSNLIYFVSSHL